MAGQIISLFSARENAILSGAINLTTDNFYFHLVTAIPSTNTASLVSDLALANYTGYAPVAVTVQTFTSGVWRLDPQVDFPVNTGSSQTIVGIVVCRRLGASPASTDEAMLFIRSRIGSTYIDVNIGTATFPRVATDQTNGVLSINTSLVGYPTGSFAFLNDTNGAFYLLGTQAGAVAWNNPEGVQITTLDALSSSNMYDRNLATNASAGIDSTADFIIDFGTGGNRVRLSNSVLMLNHRVNLGSGSFPATLEGAHSLVDGVSRDDATQWNFLGTFTIPRTSTYITNSFMIPGDTNFYRYLRFNAPSTGGSSWQIQQIELYSCTIGRLIAF